MSVEIPYYSGSGQRSIDSFGDYENIPAQRGFVIVSDANIKNNLEQILKDSWRADLMETRVYFRWASLLANKIVKGEVLSDNDMNAFKAICLMAAGDKPTLKGALVVQLLMRGIKNRNVGKKPVIEKQKGHAVLVLRQDGYTLDRIAEIEGISKSTVQRILSQNKKAYGSKQI